MEEYNQMVADLFKSGEEMQAQLNPKDLQAMHAVMGLSGEVAELMEPLLDSTDNQLELDYENIKEELGDLEFYLQALRFTYGITRGSPHFDLEKPRLRKSLNWALLAKNQDVCIACGKILDLVKKAVIYRKEIQLPKLELLIRELDGHLFSIRSFIGLSRKEIMVGNMCKLTGKEGRYASGKYSDEAAQDRADKTNE